jgi:putative transcriptional regulator
MTGSLRGQLLVAAPSLHDFFHRTVVLMVEHTEDGAFGVVLNKPSETTVEEAIPDFASLTGPEEPLRIGGPVEPGAVVLLGEFDDPEACHKLVVGDVGVVDVEDPEAELGRVRAYAGHSGWGAGQLEDELEQEAWLVQTAEPEDAFSDADLWSAVLERRGGEFALLARMPEDPSLN